MNAQYQAFHKDIELKEEQSLDHRMKNLLTGVATLLCLLGLNFGGFVLYKLYASWEVSNTPSFLMNGKSLAVTQQYAGKLPKAAAMQGRLSKLSRTAIATGRQTVTNSNTREVGVRHWE